MYTDFQLSEMSYEAGQSILAQRSGEYRKKHGQFLTPPVIARYMASQMGIVKHGARMLDPAVGSGTLLCALVERLITEGQPLEIWLDGYEIDDRLCRTATNALDRSVQQAAPHGIIIHPRIIKGDFILENIGKIHPTLFSSLDEVQCNYQHIIANPPYFKVNADDQRVQAARGMISGHTNIYTMFMALSVNLLAAGGRACFIVPRSFCSGAYFSTFRRHLLRQATLLSVHLFESRQEAFRQDAVLQENVILTFQRKPEVDETLPEQVQVSASQNTADLLDTCPRLVSTQYVVHRGSRATFFRLPASEYDEQVLDVMDSWTGSLHHFGLEASTGPVVPFRASEFLLDSAEPEAVPLLWLQHIKPQRVEWPLKNGRYSKPQWIKVSGEGKSLLIPTGNYVIIRRFSPKEEARRLIAAPLMSEQFNYPALGVENHLNYIHRKGRSLAVVETLGLSALYNSALFDRYFRITNGNTQVNANELRTLPLPPLSIIERIGEGFLTTRESTPDVIVQEVLKAARLLPSEFPLIQKNRSV